MANTGNMHSYWRKSHTTDSVYTEHEESEHLYIAYFPGALFV